MEFQEVNKKYGFTIIEIIIVITITIILATGAVLGAGTIVLSIDLNTASHNITTSTETAKDYSLDKLNGYSNYGIYFTTSSYTLYAGTTYSSSSPVIYTVALPAGVSLNSINFNGNSFVYFQSVTGLPSNTGSVMIKTSMGSYTMSVISSGSILLTKN